MKRHILFILLICAFTFSGTAAFAQDSRSQERENVEAAKIAFLSDEMALTPEQAQKFWPLYNEYEAKRRQLVKGYRGGYRRDVEALSDEEAKNRIEAMFSTREKELKLEKEYAARYQQVVSPKQLIKLYRGEREFTKLLLKRLHHKKENQ